MTRGGLYEGARHRVDPGLAGCWLLRSATVTLNPLNWDPFDEDLDRNPYPVWKRLRDDAPLYRNDEYDFWALSRFEDVEAAHRDPSVFSSAHGTVLERMEVEAGGSRMMIFLDPPDHTMLRRLVSRSVHSPPHHGTRRADP